MHVWAWYRGFADGRTRDLRPNRLTVTVVRDQARLDAVIARLVPAIGVAAVPRGDGLDFTGVDLYFLRGELLAAEDDDAFGFEITGAEARPVAEALTPPTGSRSAP